MFIGQSWRKQSLLTRFTLTGLTLTLTIAALFGWALGSWLERSALEQEAESAADTVNLVLDPFLRPEDFDGPPTLQRLTEIEQRIRERIVRDHIVRIKIWNPDGMVVYSSDLPLVGQQFVIGDANDELREALEGHQAMEVSDLSKAENRHEANTEARLLEVYVPIRLGRNRVYGAYEIYHDLTAVAPRIAAMQRIVWLSVLGAFGVLYLALFGLVRRASQELRQQSDELARLEAQREIGRAQREMISVVSHELRTPLTTLVGFSELLLSPNVSTEDRRSWTALVHSESTRMGALVEELLDVSRLEEGSVRAIQQPVDVTAVIERALASVRPLAGDHRIVDKHETEVPKVMADPDKLTQVFVNLFSNAIKYSPNGAPVTVETASTGESVEVRVIDQGLGLPAEEIPKLFARFHRVHDHLREGIPGTGLGLYITRQLVELQGGRVWVESAGPGLGSTFRVALQVASLQQQAA